LRAATRFERVLSVNQDVQLTSDQHGAQID
jgi:hypothetical protein